MAEAHVHGNDRTMDMTLYRGGRKLTTVQARKTVSSPYEVVFLTYGDVSPVPRSTRAFDQWSKEDVICVLEFSQGPYLPAEVGDEIRHLDGGHPDGHRWRHTVTQDDIDRGYVAAGSYMGRSGRLEHPVFLRPRSFVQSGTAERPSESILGDLPAASTAPAEEGVGISR